MTSVAAGAAKLAVRHHLEPAAAARLTRLAELLMSHPLAPTTVRSAEGVLHDHLADSLVALELPEARAASVIADLGSGAGLPGLPLAIALPGSTVSLVESATRKCEFLLEVVAECALANAEVVHARAEAWPEGLERFDLVTARALAALAVVVEYAAPLLRLGGVLVVWRGRREPEAELQAERAASEVGMRPREPIRVVPYRGAEHRHLHVFTKAEPTPPRFPRRPGVAQKRPLGRI